nr:MAG TPA: hypothetical protein [Caudoviricetes sp.]DAY09993.1 MAG TPA: hypothetical protein [Caudoviricetes sp.]
MLFSVKHYSKQVGIYYYKYYQPQFVLSTL